MKKFIIFGMLILFVSCASLSKQQRMERDMFDPQRKGSELREQKQHEKKNKQNKKWTKMPKHKK